MIQIIALKKNFSDCYFTVIKCNISMNRKLFHGKHEHWGDMKKRNQNRLKNVEPYVFLLLKQMLYSLTQDHYYLLKFYYTHLILVLNFCNLK